jgi:hypothetical protein
LLELADPTTVKRNRAVGNATPEEVIPLGLDLMVEEMAEEGFAGYEPSTIWERDRFNPTTLVFEGPAGELDRLFLLLDDSTSRRRSRPPFLTADS